MRRTGGAAGAGPLRVLRLARGLVLGLSLGALGLAGLVVASLGLRSLDRVLTPGEWSGLLEVVGLRSVLIYLLGILIGGFAGLTALRGFEVRIGRERRAKYQVALRARQTQAATVDPGIRADVGRTCGVEAILVVDLVQSTELVARHGDVFFRNLLRRMEAAFIPEARQRGTRCVDGFGDALLFSFEGADRALDAARAMYAHIPAINSHMPPGVEVAFRASLHVGETLTDSRGNRTGLAVLKASRLGSAMGSLLGRGAGRNSLVISAEALAALQGTGVPTKPLGEVELRGFPGTHPVYQVDI